MMVCSADSAIGPSIINPKKPIPTNHIDDTTGKSIQIVHIIRFTRRRVLTGFFQRPYFPTTIPQAMNPILVIARTVPQISTDTSESP